MSWASQYLQQAEQAAGGPATLNSDGTYTITSGPNAGNIITQGIGGAVMIPPGGNASQAVHLTGSDAGQSFAVNQNVGMTALKALAPWIGAGVVSNALSGGGGGDTPGPDSGPTSGQWTTDDNGNIIPSGSTPGPSGSTPSGGGTSPNWLQTGIQTGAGLFSGYEQGQQAANAQKITQGGQAIQATQLNPYAQLQDSQKQALASALLANYQPMTYTPGTQSSGPNPTMTSAGTFNGGVGGALSNPLFQAQIAPFFSQGTQEAADQNFQSTVAGANPLYQNPFTTQGAQALGFGGGSTPSSSTPGSPGSMGPQGSANLLGPTQAPGAVGPPGTFNATPPQGSPNSNLALLSNSLIPKPTNYLPLGGS